MKSLVLIALLMCSSAYAQPERRPEPPPRHGPPPEAIEACKGKADGTAVEMKTRRGDLVKGTCRMVMIPDHDGNAPER
jgi:hypothetical protein